MRLRPKQTVLFLVSIKEMENKMKDYSKYIGISLSEIPFKELSVGLQVQSKATKRFGVIVQLGICNYENNNTIGSSRDPWIKVKFDDVKRCSLQPHRDIDYAEDNQPWSKIVIFEERK